MENSSKYKGRYYSERHQKTIHAATTVLSFVLERIPKVESAVDFGCGVGTWLSVLAEDHGVKSVYGLDGDWVDPKLLEIPETSFQITDLSKPVALEKRYDLAVSLEVGEHLPGESASDFVDSICKAADFVLFSAAIPGQGGQGHVNMQWPEYWAELFGARNYECVDIVRSSFWDDERIPVWYRQNCMLYVSKAAMDRVKLSRSESDQVGKPRSLVHPQFFLSKVQQFRDRETDMATASRSFRLFVRACKRSVKKLFTGS